VVKPMLMTLSRFAKLWTWLTAFRNKVAIKNVLGGQQDQLIFCLCGGVGCSHQPTLHLHRLQLFVCRIRHFIHAVLDRVLRVSLKLLRIALYFLCSALAF
jgi:hypothetical protein